MTSDTHAFKPGEKAPTSGVYEVAHDKLDSEHHAHPHRVILISGATFPRCRGCGGEVRYRVIEAVDRIEEHPLLSTDKQ